MKKVRQVASEEVWRSGSHIVQNVLGELTDLDAPETSRPKPTNLICVANRRREKKLPKHPKSLDLILLMTSSKRAFFKGMSRLVIVGTSSLPPLHNYPPCQKQRPGSLMVHSSW